MQCKITYFPWTAQITAHVFLFYIAILSTFLTTQRCTSNLNLGTHIVVYRRFFFCVFFDKLVCRFSGIVCRLLSWHFLPPCIVLSLLCLNDFLKWVVSG